ncbi:MORN repeat-containing protein [Leptospira bandrabouensis]|uniref:Membrane-binding protein n=1 Tax=Leptospira bandrabouensis TaxID=2484903 RepID=A0A6H3NNI6_9LEPT|nr:membrane-binding protein [Leptospira bandrabouensis]MCG6146445.1 membrane-binding protein [Leptospira bandrabouensis]MCG6153963.1 membrane-binding protein [Leptospira bandrabouensis]MCG6161592.1 membrane-binding protein [Leptospira bandrabouensis]MCG6166032.1 membrane-binding protein [Leptospira bandrabouensis]MCW7459817.1 membrane-binding protein [Leptospira bandrabouensis]
MKRFKLPLNRRHLIFATLGIAATLVILALYVTYNRAKCTSGDCDTGFGVLELKDGTYYAGGFLNHRFHDYGILKHISGEKYEGYWHRGEKSGKGKIYYADGAFYEGNFRRNVKHGEGYYVWSDGTKIAGFFVDGEPQGKCTLTLPNKLILIGEYNRGIVINGEGIYIYDDQSRYIGNWKNGKRNGKGTLLSPSGEIVNSGTWKNDVFQGN